MANNRNIVIILMGPPGVGKGTQSFLLQKHYNIPALSSGNILSNFIQNNIDNKGEQGELASKLKKIINRGELIQDEIITDIISKRMLHSDCQRGCILDGFPRNVNQADILSSIIEGAGVKPDIIAVVSISLDAEMLFKRISGRIVCKGCRASYNKYFLPTVVAGVCDNCGGVEFLNRDDDSEDVIRNRIKTYRAETSPLIEYYRGKTWGLLEVDGDNSHVAIFDQIKAYIASL